MNWSWHNTDQVWVFLRLTYFYTIYCPLLKCTFSDFSPSSFDLKFGIWICPHVLQVKFNFLSCFTYFLLSYCPLLKLSFPNFSISPYKIMTWVFWMNLYRHKTDQVSLWPLWSAFVGVMPLENLLGPVGDLYCISNTFRMLVLFLQLLIRTRQ